MLSLALKIRYVRPEQCFAHVADGLGFEAARDCGLWSKRRFAHVAGGPVMRGGRRDV